MSIEIGKTYYWNNHPAIPMLKSNEVEYMPDLYLCRVFVNTAPIEYREFCAPCYMGDYRFGKCTCDELEYLSDEYNEIRDAGEMIWVNEIELKEKQIELKILDDVMDVVREKKAELKTLEEKIKKDTKEWENSFEINKNNLYKLSKEINSKGNEVEELNSEIEKLKVERSGVTEGFNAKYLDLSFEDLVYLLDRDNQLTALEIGGVDNWQWHELSLSDNYNENDAYTRAKNYLK